MKPCLALLTLCLLASSSRGDDRVFPDRVYGHKDGLALTLDVVKPLKPNGAGVLWIQSGGWHSNWTEPAGFLTAGKPYLDKGYTLFIVRHGSAPKYAVPEAVADVRRAVRYIRLHAKEFGVDPERLGVTGGSAGGHLSLMLGTTGDDGDPKAKDEVLRQSSRVAAVACLFPPTDISTWTTDPPDAIKAIPSLKPPLTFDAKLAPEVSPLLKVTPQAAPSLMVHGDKDELVPVEHSRRMVAALEKAKVPCELIVIEGAGHGFSPKQYADVVTPALLGWFDKYLATKK